MKVSVVIPMYNSICTIKEAINSVINQSYLGPIEIIVVNDGSTDGCETIVETLIVSNETNRSIKLINKINGGVSSARNAGIKAASASWVALLDSDDIWLPKKLEKQISEVEKNPNIKFIGTNRNGEIYPFFDKSKKKVYSLSTKEVIAKWYPHTSTVLVNKSILSETALYDEERTHAEDGDFLLRLSETNSLYILNESLVYTGGGKRSFGDSGLSANLPKMYSGEILALKGALKRKQVSFFEYLAFYSWLTLKYFRRVLVVWISK